jgi:16S rRNA (cytidine1402-2'-O)-methyltransferase
MSGTLYVIATPIGNLEDVSMRTVRVLREVSAIVAEDTRTARKLLDRYEIPVPMLISYFAGNQKRRIPQILSRLAAGDQLALISEAGTPGINDPGYDLVRAGADAGIDIVAIPGPSAVPTLLSVSGLPSDQYTFVGFLPRRSGERNRLLLRFADLEWPLVAFESPHRLRASLTAIVEVMGDDRPVVVGRELTKRFEEIYRGPVSGALERFQRPRGEFTLVLAPLNRAERRQRAAAESSTSESPPTDPAPRRSRRSRATRL